VTLRRAIVTGGSAGIGAEVCRQLLTAGYEVISLARRTGDIRDPRFSAIEVDLSNADATRRIAFELARERPATTLVHNAGAVRERPLEQVTPEDLDTLVGLHIAAPIAVFAPWIMATFGPGFRDGTWVLVTLCATAVVFSPYWIVGQSLVSRGHVWTMFLFNLGWAVTLLATEWLLRGYGARGLALAYLMADMARLTAALIYANRMRSLEWSSESPNDVAHA